MYGVDERGQRGVEVFIYALVSNFRLKQGKHKHKYIHTLTRTAKIKRTILYAPFVPFIVLFCHIVEFSSKNSTKSHQEDKANNNNKAIEAEIGHDINRLEEFVLSLEPLASLSEAITKLHRLCQALVIIAKLYNEAKTKVKDRSTINARMQMQMQDNSNNNNNNHMDYSEAEADTDASVNVNNYNNNDNNDNNDNNSSNNNNNNDDNDNNYDLNLVQMGQEFDIYLSALGFVPGQTIGGSTTVTDPVVGGGAGTPSSYGNNGLGFGFGSGLGPGPAPGSSSSSGYVNNNGNPSGWASMSMNMGMGMDMGMGMGMGTGTGVDNMNMNTGIDIGNNATTTTTPHTTNIDTPNPNNSTTEDTNMTLTTSTTMMDNMPSSTATATTTDLERQDQQQQQQQYPIPVTATNQLSPPSMLQSMQLGNWFSGNRYIMGLLEEDLSQFDFDPTSLGVG